MLWIARSILNVKFQLFPPLSFICLFLKAKQKVHRFRTEKLDFVCSYIFSDQIFAIQCHMIKKIHLFQTNRIRYLYFQATVINSQCE